MRIYALVGKSGTGKSYKAQYVAGLYEIEYILDDGILIKSTKIIAGSSAKREDTMLAAVRRAIFVNEDHREEVKKALKECDPEKLLIVGTSEHMIRDILKALGIESGYELIRIEDISSTEEIDEAMKTRRNKGKHVIPVPTFEIKKDFSGYFMDSIKNLVKGNEKPHETNEKSVVRPTFSYLGSYEIKDSVLKTITEMSLIQSKDIYKVHYVEIQGQKTGVIILVNLTAKLIRPIPEIINDAACNIKNNFEHMTGINVMEVNVVVKSVVIENLNT